MKKYFASAAVIAISIGSALAADLPSRKAPQIAPPPPPPPMWTGFYAGINLGATVGTNSNATSTLYQNSAMVYNDVGQRQIYYPVLTGNAVNAGGGGRMTQTGVIGGGQIGYNYQWPSSQFVIGLEADFQGADVSGRSFVNGITDAISSPIYPENPGQANTEYYKLYGTTQQEVTARLNWIGTVRGRLGYLFTPTLLTYATGGLTYGGVTQSSTLSATQHGYMLNERDVLPAAVAATTTQLFGGGGRRSQTLVGWNAGGGFEWMFMPNWSLKAEAIYWNLGSTNFGARSSAGNAAVDMCPGECDETVNITSGVFGGPTRVNYQGVIARAGLNYHFNFGALNPDFLRF